MSKGRGWFSQPGRHSLASRGIKTTFKNVGRHGGIHERGNYKHHSRYEEKIGEFVKNIHFILGEVYRAINDKHPQTREMQEKVSKLYTIIDEEISKLEKQKLSEKSRQSIIKNSDRLMQDVIPDRMEILDNSELQKPTKELIEQCYTTLYNAAYMAKKFAEDGNAETAKKSLKIELNMLENDVGSFSESY